MEAGASHPAGGLAGAAAPAPAPRRFIPGIAVSLCGAAPFLLAAFAWQRDGGELSGAGLIGGCPMLEVVGIPCASCGAARAFFHLTHGDAAFLEFNWFWPIAALLAAGYGAVLLARAALGADPFGPWARGIARRYATQPARMAAATLAVLLVPWVIALANADAIRSA
ncbi:MAG TPA: DUF2752 domain-containing protein [Solirubrobacterales bacterium]